MRIRHAVVLVPLAGCGLVLALDDSRAISADGCELWLDYFILGEASSSWTVARRDL